MPSATLSSSVVDAAAVSDVFVPSAMAPYTIDPACVVVTDAWCAAAADWVAVAPVWEAAGAAPVRTLIRASIPWLVEPVSVAVIGGSFGSGGAATATHTPQYRPGKLFPAASSVQFRPPPDTSIVVTDPPAPFEPTIATSSAPSGGENAAVVIVMALSSLARAGAEGSSWITPSGRISAAAML